MSEIMSNTCQYRDLNEFLAKHSAVDSQSGIKLTHTRIPDKDLNIYGAKFIIPKEELPLFYELYYKSIFINKRNEYLTEKQLETGGPMAVDLDFRYSYDVITRQHTESHIEDMITEYLEVIEECYIIKPNIPFDVFIFEKPNVNRLADGSLTKDGIHMIIGLQIDFIMQGIIRDKMLIRLENIWKDDLPLINEWDSVLDSGISTGKTNWQLFGSKKPGNEAYELTYHYEVHADQSDGQLQINPKEVKNFDLKQNFKKLSVQYDKHPKFEINPKIINEYNERTNKKKSKIKKTSSRVKINFKPEIVDDDDNENDEDSISIYDIKNEKNLDKAISIMLKNLSPNDYEINELHHFTQALPEKYYEPGSHLLNRQVAFALKHTDERLFLSWIKLRSKASDFSYDSIPELYAKWKHFQKSNEEGKQVTRKSIMYWLRKDNFEEYEKIKKTTIDYYLEKAVETGTEDDLAILLKHIYKDEYVCVSYDKRGWYQYDSKKHRWLSDRGLSLRKKISEELYLLFSSKEEQLGGEVKEYAGKEDNREEFLKKRIKVIAELRIKLKRTNDKDKILREAGEKFYDEEFLTKIDTNKELLCFNNGVVDFKNKVFRDGYPEDYITKTTNINYIPYNENDPEFMKIVNEVKHFMETLFPIPDLNRYMWDHLASCLIGSNKNQTFNVYHGSGSNGKSILADLMSLVLGEYKGVVPITLVTESRGRIGSTSDEIVKLKGVRYAVMQEPSKGVKLNEGIMKELTGGDPIQARGLYSESETFEPQFKLVVCTNNLFDIESNDDGTWRRIRKCDFLSKFVDEGEEHTDETPHVYVKDKTLKEKLPLFAPVFASILVKRAFETDGIVQDCETVMRASNKYRCGQDHISAFMVEKIIKTDNPKDKIKKKELLQEFKVWFEENQGSKKAPKGEEIYQAMDKKFGKGKTTGWHGVKILYPENENEDEFEV